MLVEIEGHRIAFDRPEKWVWFDGKLTILDLARYYVAVSPWLLPHLEQRPIVYETYRGTIDGPNSFEQDPPPDTPAWVERTKVRGRERVVTYVIAGSAATLVYLVSVFMVTVHVWQSTTRRIENPDFLLVDLDPTDECTLAKLSRAAIRVREYLQERGIAQPLVKSSGARGLHVVAYIEPECGYKAVRALSRSIASDLAKTYPEEFTVEREPKKRPRGAVYVDWGQVGRGMTIVPPFSPRACEGAPVSMPLDWGEIERCARSRSKRPPIEYFKRYNVRTALEILRKSGDPWQGRRASSIARLVDHG